MDSYEIMFHDWTRRRDRPYEVLQKPWAGAKAKRVRKKYILQEGIENLFVVKAGTRIYRLEDDIKVVTEDGEELHPTGRFYRTCETIDPFHAILDIWQT